MEASHGAGSGRRSREDDLGLFTSGTLQGGSAGVFRCVWRRPRRCGLRLFRTNSAHWEACPRRVAAFRTRSTALSSTAHLPSYAQNALLTPLPFPGQHVDAESPPNGQGSSDDDDDDDFVDPALKNASFPRSPGLPLRAPPARFATHTGMFLPLPATNDDVMTAVDYTHISQALAHQPLATNPSQQTIDLMTKLESAGTVEGSLEERMDAFMKEVKTQVRFALPPSRSLPPARPAHLSAPRTLTNESASSHRCSTSLNASTSSKPVASPPPPPSPPSSPPSSLSNPASSLPPPAPPTRPPSSPLPPSSPKR